MCTIVLKDIMDVEPLLPEAGKMFYTQVIEGIEGSEKVVVDMSSVTALPSVFLNVSIGRLIDEKGKDWLKRNLVFTMITKQQVIRLKEYLAKYESA